MTLEKIPAYSHRNPTVVLYRIERQDARQLVMDGHANWINRCKGIRVAKDSYPVFQGYHLDELLARHRGKTRMPHQTNAKYRVGKPSMVNSPSGSGTSLVPMTI